MMASVQHDNVMDWPRHGSEQTATADIGDCGGGTGVTANFNATEAHFKNNDAVEESSQNRQQFPDNKIIQLQQCQEFPVGFSSQNQIIDTAANAAGHHLHGIQAIRQQQIGEQNNSQIQQNHLHQQNASDPSTIARSYQRSVEQRGVYQQQYFPEVERPSHLQYALQHENINDYNNTVQPAKPSVKHDTTHDLRVSNNRKGNSESISIQDNNNATGENPILRNYPGQSEQRQQFQMMESTAIDNIGMDAALAAQAVEAAAPMYNGAFNNYPTENNRLADSRPISEAQKIHLQQQQQNYLHHQLDEPNCYQQQSQMEDNNATNQQFDNNNFMTDQVQNPNNDLANHTVTTQHSQYNQSILYIPQIMIAPQYQYQFSQQQQPYIQQQHSQQQQEQYSQKHQNPPMQNQLVQNGNPTSVPPYPPPIEGNSFATSTEIMLNDETPANINNSVSTEQQHNDQNLAAASGDGRNIPTNQIQNHDTEAPTTIGFHPQNSTYEAANARKMMDELLNEQSKCTNEILLAEQELLRAQQRLEAANRNKDHMDAKVNEVAEQLTDSLLKEHTKWNAQYKKLKKYKDATGHCDLKRNPTRSSKGRKDIANDTGIDDPSTLSSLGSWIGQVRLEARRPPGHPDRLEAYKIIALNRLGFDWQPRENYWMDMYEQLKVYLKENDGKMPPRTVNNKKFPLGVWCDTQLDNYRKYCSGRKGAYITQEKIDMLNSIGFVWNRQGKMWMDNYEKVVQRNFGILLSPLFVFQVINSMCLVHNNCNSLKLKAFKAKHKTCQVTPSACNGDTSFSSWVSKQRRKYQNYIKGEKQDTCVTEEQARLLEEIGFQELFQEDGKRKKRRKYKKRKVDNLTTLDRKGPDIGAVRMKLAAMCDAADSVENQTNVHTQQNFLHNNRTEQHFHGDNSILDEAGATTQNDASRMVDAIMGGDGKVGEAGDHHDSGECGADETIVSAERMWI